jgi:hypothetical protein
MVPLASTKSTFAFENHVSRVKSVQFPQHSYDDAYAPYP